MNVIDELKDCDIEEIKKYCNKLNVPASVAMFNTGYDFNIASILRTANVLGFQSVYHIQKEGRRIDKRATVGAHYYTDLIHCYNADEFFNKIQDKYVPVAVENNISFESKNAFDYVPPKNCCFIFGAESKGLDDDVLIKCKDIITIPNFGCIRSFNVGVTAGIVMGLYSKIHRSNENNQR